jgi:hypothetical protein
MLDCDCGEYCVHDKRAGGLAVAYKTAQDILVSLTGLKNTGGRLGKPGGNRRFGLGGGQRAVEYSGICSNPQKGPQREPSEADEIGLREYSFKPNPAFLVLLSSRVISIEQQIRIHEDQR